MCHGWLWCLSLPNPSRRLAHGHVGSDVWVCNRIVRNAMAERSIPERSIPQAGMDCVTRGSGQFQSFVAAAGCWAPRLRPLA